jgi:hypothetical protein
MAHKHLHGGRQAGSGQRGQVTLNRSIYIAIWEGRAATDIVPNGQELVADEAVALALDESVPVELEADRCYVIKAQGSPPSLWSAPSDRTAGVTKGATAPFDAVWAGSMNRRKYGARLAPKRLTKTPSFPKERGMLSQENRDS